MIDLFAKGGILIWPILICSLIGWYIFFSKLLIFRSAQEKGTTKNILLLLVAEKKFAKAREFAKNKQFLHPGKPTAVEKLLRDILSTEIADRNTLEVIVSHGVEREIKYLSRNLGTLAVLGNISPLLGLLGTVVGMIKAFMVVEGMGGRVNASLLAGGIWEAMLTTAFGLIVAIPLMIFHNYLLGRLHLLQAGLEEAAIEVIKSWPKQVR